MDIYKGLIKRNGMPIPVGSNLFSVDNGATGYTVFSAEPTTAELAELEDGHLLFWPDEATTMVGGGGGFVPDYANQSATNLVNSTGGTFPIIEDGFIRYGAVSTNGLGVYINGKAIDVVAQSNGIVYGGILPVKAGDTVEINNAGLGAISSATCFFIPPRQINIPISTNPHTWRDDGIEVNLGDGIFGIKRTGEISSTANTRVFQTISAQADTSRRILDSGGWFDLGNNTIQAIGHSNMNDAMSSISFSVVDISPIGDVRLFTRGSVVRNNAKFYVWVRYIKV